MSTSLRVLIVEDSEDDLALLLRELRRGNYDPSFERVDTPAAMQSALAQQTWDMVISDYVMPNFSGPGALALLQKSGLDLPFIIVSGVIGEETAVAAMKAGAHDYILKGDLARLIPAIERELREAARRREHKHLQEQLLHSQKVEAVGRLAGGVAHDFNNLLTAIMGYTQLGLMALPPDQHGCSYLAEIQHAAERAAGLTRQLLAFSRRQIIEPRVINLNELITSLDKMLRRLIGEDIELLTRPAPDLGPVKVDPGQMEQVLMNLAVNSRDAMPDGGRLIIETANASLAEEQARQQAGISPGQYVMLSISDNGIGMSDEVKAHIFEPFFTTKELGKGTGLGLATCYGIVKQSGGYIEVSSQPGQGTTFRIYLPLIDGAEVQLTPGEAPGSLVEGSETVLLVEDEALVRDLAVRTLQSQGYRVLEAANGAEALRVAQEHPGGEIDLLLTDMVMPQMGGRELAERLRAVHPCIKVLFTSGYTDEAIGRHGILAPGVEFMQKPFSLTTLALKVRGVLDSSGYGPPAILTRREGL